MPMTRPRTITAPFTGNCASRELPSRPTICGSRPSSYSIRLCCVPAMRILTRCLSSHACREQEVSCLGVRELRLLPKVVADGFRLHSGHNRRQCGRVCLLHCLHAAEVFEKPPGRAFSYTGDFQQFGRTIAHLAAFAMESQGETVSFVADELDQVQHRRMVVERDRIFFLSIDVENLFALGDSCERLINDLERFQRLGGGVQLAQAAVD